MPSITVRNIDDDLKKRLKDQAAKHGCSMEEEVRRILREALPYRENPPEGLGTSLHNHFKSVALTDEEYEIFSSAFDRSKHCSCQCHTE
jgi:plasmid stability protein